MKQIRENVLISPAGKCESISEKWCCSLNEDKKPPLHTLLLITKGFLLLFCLWIFFGWTQKSNDVLGLQSSVLIVASFRQRLYPLPLPCGVLSCSVSSTAFSCSIVITLDLTHCLVRTYTHTHTHTHRRFVSCSEPIVTTSLLHCRKVGHEEMNGLIDAAWTNSLIILITKHTRPGR